VTAFFSFVGKEARQEGCQGRQGQDCQGWSSRQQEGRIQDQEEVLDQDQGKGKA